MRFRVTLVNPDGYTEAWTRDVSHDGLSAIFLMTTTGSVNPMQPGQQLVIERIT